MNNTTRVIFWVLYISTLAVESTYKAGKYCAPYILKAYDYCLENAPMWWEAIKSAAKVAKPYVAQATAATIVGAQWVWEHREELREAAAQPFVYRNDTALA